MIGAKQFEITWTEFVSGMTTTDFSEDGGFSPGTTASPTIINPIVNPGVLNMPCSPVTHSTNLTGEIIASCEDPAAVAARLLVSRDSGADGRFYSMDSAGDLTERGAEDTTADYISGRTDMIGFDGEAYVTTASTIVRWQQPNTFNYSFFTFSDAFAPHPAIVYEGFAYYGDGNLLLRQTAAGGTPTTILTLPSSQVIVTLGIDPGSGKMLISVVDQYNVSGTVNTQPRVLYYDGQSNKASKVVLVDDMITAFYNCGGYVYVGYPQKLGYWTGSGIQFLRRVSMTFDNTQLLYKHHFTNIGQTLYLIEQTKILAYGEVVPGNGKVFYYAMKNNEGDSGNYSLCVNIGQNRLGLAFATAKWFTFDTMSNANVINGGATFRTRRYRLPRDGTYNTVRIYFSQALPTTSENLFTISFIDSDGTTTALRTVGGTAAQRFIDAPWPAISTFSFQVLLSIAPETPTNIVPIERMILYFNPTD